jgi:murein L,D-transpeptidase YafK
MNCRFAALVLCFALASCTPEGFMPKHKIPVPARTLSLMQEKGMDPRAPILMRVYKSEARLEIWKKNRSGQYIPLKSFDICRWSGDLGPKQREGDRQAPEGFYTITPVLMNPNSNYYLSFDTGFPNAYDRAHNWSGSNLMVHGDCTSRGCYAMTNEAVEEIYALARDAFDGGQRGFQLQLLPFRMTADNLYKYRKNPNIAFWKNLKEGSDHFEVTQQEPVIAVCSYRYVFNQVPFTPDARFEPTGMCPPAAVPAAIQSALAARMLQEAPVMAKLDDKGEKKDKSVIASLLGDDTPEHKYDTRDKILNALPASSPEALSLLPGVEHGASSELRRIAGFAALPPPPPRATGTIAPYYIPKDDPVLAAAQEKLVEPPPPSIKTAATKPAKPKIEAGDSSMFLRGTQ